MTRGFVHTFDPVPYARPSLLCGKRLETTLATRMQCLELWLQEDELARLLREQEADMAGNDEATGLHPDGFQRPEGGG